MPQVRLIPGLPRPSMPIQMGIVYPDEMPAPRRARISVLTSFRPASRGMQQIGSLYGGQMGASDRRQIVMTGTAVIQNIITIGGIYTNDQIAQDLINSFTSAGWDVNYLRITGGNTVAFSRTVNIQLSVNVLWSYTTADVRQSAVSGLEAFTYNIYAAGGPTIPIRPISNVSLIVQSEEPRDSVLPTPDPAPKPDPTKVPPGAPTPDILTTIGTTLGFGGVGAVVGAATGGLLAVALVLVLALREN